MPWLEGHPSLPFSGSTTISRHASYAGAKAAEPRAGSQALRLLMLYRESGPQTDHEASEALGLPLATICARRNWLYQRGFVASVSSKVGPFGVTNSIWELA